MSPSPLLGCFDQLQKHGLPITCGNAKSVHNLQKTKIDV